MSFETERNRHVHNLLTKPIREYALAIATLFATLVGIESISLAQSRLLTMEQVRAIAVAEVPGATRIEIELEADADGTRGVYEVELHDPRGVEHDLAIDAVTGAVLYHRIDD
jgi:uncharacterized membrane protein YkoI